MLPKRIILSRKGVDTSAGRFPSLILNDRLLSIPIPESEYDHSKRYRDVPLPAGPWQQYRNFEVLLKSLPRIAANQSSTKLVHLDPDIRRELHADREHWHPAFGQCCGAETELTDVESGDLFLFFGWFKNAKYAGQGKIKFFGRDRHVLWGWLQVHERLEAPCKQFSSHPHSFVSTRGTPGHRNSLRTPLKHLTFDAAVPGYGCFTNWKEQLSLTDPEAETMSAWRLPSFFYRALSRCNENPTWWRKGEWCGLSYRGYGQEFVFSLPQQDQPALNAVDKWLQGLPFQ